MSATVRTWLRFESDGERVGASWQRGPAIVPAPFERRDREAAGRAQQAPRRMTGMDAARLEAILLGRA